MSSIVEDMPAVGSDQVICLVRTGDDEVEGLMPRAFAGQLVAAGITRPTWAQLNDVFEQGDEFQWLVDPIWAVTVVELEIERMQR